MDSAIYIFDLIGVGVFAISGALAAAEKRLDILGFILFGTITGIGGGTARNLHRGAGAGTHRGPRKKRGRQRGQYTVV